MLDIDREKIKTALEPVVQEQGFELLDLEWKPEPGGWTLRLILDHDSKPIMIKDCEAVSRRAGQFLDEANLIGRRYNLEVSSPGLRRPLKKEKDYLRFLGEKARIELSAPLEGANQKVFSGTLEAVSGGKILLTDGLNRWQFDLAQVQKANLDPEIVV